MAEAQVRALSEAAPTVSDVPPSSRRLWAGRAVCLLAGVALVWGEAAVTHSFPRPGWFALAVAIAFMVQYVRCGPPWHYLALSSGMLAAPLLAVACVFVAPGVIDRLLDRDFDADVWRAAAVGSSEARVWMVDDLLTSRSPVGRQVSEIDAELGPDDRSQGCFSDWDRVWRLGMQRGLIRMDGEWLVLRVNAEGVVTEARIVID